MYSMESNLYCRNKGAKSDTIRESPCIHIFFLNFVSPIGNCNIHIYSIKIKNILQIELNFY
jgi:hypothetical protein